VTKVNEYKITIDPFTLLNPTEDGEPTAEMITTYLRECFEIEGESGLEFEAEIIGQKEF